MNFLNTVKHNYLQHARSYAFLITLCISLAIAYTFVPEPNANYSTIRISNYVGYYNSAWFGYVTAIMTSVFLSLIGFYLVNSGIKKDIDTKVGQIVASTQLSNFQYLLAKTFSNFLILLTIVGVIFSMSIVLFFLYNDGFPFEIWQFIKPYLLIPIPAMFLVAVFAVMFEVIFRKYSVIQNVAFFFLFTFLMIPQPATEIEFATDVFGSKIVIHQLEETVKNIKGLNENIDMNIGYVLGNTSKPNKFDFNGIDFPTSFIFSRSLWVFFGLICIGLISPIFHRFEFKKTFSKVKKKSIFHSTGINDIVLSSLPKPQINFRIFLMIKTELLLLIRQGNKWLWLLNAIGMVFLAIFPVNISHQLALPVLWFLQVGRLSSLTTKEMTNNVHYFAFASYNPLRRLLTSQIVSAFLLMVLLAIPLLVRFVIENNVIAFALVVLGAVFIVLLASTLGVLSRGKKLFEVLFFMLTYANINKIPFADYFGGLKHSIYYTSTIILLILGLNIILIFTRSQQLKKL